MMNISSVIATLKTLSKREDNVDKVERYLSALAGGYMLYSAFNSKHKAAKSYTGALLLYRAVTGHCPVYSSMGKHSVYDHAQNVNIRETVYVSRPRLEVYNYWRKLDQLPLFMSHLECVEQIDETHSRWTAKIPGLPGSVSWEADVVKDEPGKLIGWTSMPGSTLDNAGKAEFSDDGEYGTEINATITYRAPLGKAGEAIARFLNPIFGKMVREDLRRFKAYMETKVINQ